MQQREKEMMDTMRKMEKRQVKKMKDPQWRAKRNRKRNPAKSGAKMRTRLEDKRLDFSNSGWRTDSENFQFERRRGGGNEKDAI